jgi:hypothetical protein
MNNLERTKAAGQLISAVDQVADGIANRILSHVWFLDDAEVDQVALTMGRLERAAYIVRGACGYTMRHRLKARRASGDVTETGRQLAELAGRWGVDYATLCKDIQMYETFHLPEKIVEPAPDAERPDVAKFFGDDDPEAPEPPGELAPQALVPTVILEHLPPRYIEEECLRAPDPRAALEMAETKRGTGNYSREQVRADVDRLRAAEAMQRSGLFGQGDTTETLLEVFWQKVPLRNRHRDALYTAARQADCSPSDLIVRWIEQGCLVLSGDALESLKAQMSAYGRNGGQHNGGDYLMRILSLRETNMVKAGEMAPTSLTANGESESEQ